MSNLTFSTQISNGIVHSEIENSRSRFFGFRKENLSFMAQAGKETPMIYILMNEKGIPVYVGQSSNGLKRVENHIREDVKKFEMVVTFELSHSKYLNFVESWFIAAMNHFGLMNKTSGNKHGLSSFELTHISHEVKILNFMVQQTMSALWSFVGVFDDIVNPDVSEEPAEKEIQAPIVSAPVETAIMEKHTSVEYNGQKFFFEFKGHKVTGAHLNDNKQFTVFAGSNMRFSDMNSISACGKITGELRRQLVAHGVVELVGDKYVFVQDYTFNEIAHAGTVCYGGTLNARTAFKNEQGVAHKECF